MARADYLELPTRDLAASRAFFAAAFGWELQAFGPSYAATMTGDVDVGLQADPAEWSAAPLPALRVADVDAAAHAVERAGGTITRAIFAFPGGRRFHFTDPSGNELAVYEPEGVDARGADTERG